MSLNFSKILLGNSGAEISRESPSLSRILGLVRGAGSGGILGSVLVNRLQGANPEYVQSQLESLCNRGLVAAQDAGRLYRGKPVVLFVAAEEVLEKPILSMEERILRLLKGSDRPLSLAVLTNRIRRSAKEDIRAALHVLIKADAVKAYKPGEYGELGKMRKSCNRAWVFGVRND